MTTSVWSKPAAINIGLGGSLLELHHDARLVDRDVRCRIDQVPEQVPGLHRLVTVAHADRQQPVQAAGHQRQLQVAVDLHRHRRAQGVHVEEVDPVLDSVLDQHPLGIPADEVRRGPAQLVGQQQGRVLMPQVRDGQLTERLVVVRQLDPAIEHPRRPVSARDVLQFDPPPRRHRGPGDLRQQLSGFGVAA